MTGFSKVLSTAKRFSRANLLFSSKNVSLNQSIKSAQFVRESHGRTMFIRPGKFYTKKYFDILHFHICLAALPFIAFIGYENFFVGPATLTNMPDDYEPRYWEYQRHPIKRILSRYVYEIPEKAYEVNLHRLYTEHCKMKMRSLEKKVKDLMYERQDYKGWFYIPVPKEPFEVKQEYNKKMGAIGFDPKFTK